MENILEIASLDVRFEQPQGQLRALRGIDLKVKKGEVLCIVGESGCGKSVLCKTIANVLCKEGIEHAGTITYDGIDLLAMPKKKRRRLCAKDMALVLQDPHTALDPRMKIGRQLDEVLKKYEKKLSRKERTQKLIEMLEQVEIDHPSQRMEQYPYMLSGGMKQRIVIAQALLKRPRILLADEPTAALDPSVSKVVLDLLKKINTSHHITIILVVHDLAAAYHYAHRVAVMYAGKVVEYGTKEDVFETPLHPYTKALLRSLPGLNKENRRLETIEGSAPLIYEDIRYDAFACRNKEADPRDFVEQASMSQFTKTHFAAVRRGNEDVWEAPVLSVCHLKKTYGFVRALDDVSFEIGRGEVYGLIGESGCGKTTLARCIMNMERWDAGDIYIGEEKIGKKQSRKTKRMLLRKRAIIFQENAAALNMRLSVRSILKEPFVISRTPYTTETLRSLMEKCGLDPSLLERPARTLSGGQLQRLCIARAIALSPDLVVADEPTASLDLSMQAQIINLFKDLQEKEGFAFLLIGHDLDLIEFAADRIGVMHDGKIVEQGSGKEVFGSPAHEYTRSLLRSTLHVYEKKEGKAR